MSKGRIIVVEDEAIIAEDIRLTVQEFGYVVPGIVDTGLGALDLAAKAQPDLALMDITLKGPVNGIEAALELRRRFNIPVIFLTAYVSDEVLQAAKQAEPYGYLLKPIEERELRSTLELALYRQRLRRARCQEVAQVLERLHALQTRLQAAADAPSANPPVPESLASYATQLRELLLRLEQAVGSTGCRLAHEGEGASE